MRDYAARGFDVVICHGTQYGNALMDVAEDFPEVSFAYGTATSTGGRANVFAYNARSEQGGYLQGIIAARLSKSRVVGVVGTGGGTAVRAMGAELLVGDERSISTACFENSSMHLAAQQNLRPNILAR